MRTFLISLSLLAITVGLCTWNFHSVTTRTKELYTLAEAIPKQADTPAASLALQAVREHWEAQKTRFALGISNDTLATVELALVEAEAYCTGAEHADFTAARQSLLLAIARLLTLEYSFF